MRSKHVKTLLLTAVSAMLLFVPSFLMAQDEVEPLPAPKLTPTIVKRLGYEGEKFSAVGSATWKLKNGVMVYSTYNIGQNIEGFAGPTPLFIAVDKQQKITAVVAAPNNETPEYFLLTKKLLKSWNGKTLKEAKTLTPDAVTGATLSSTAIIQTVQAAAAALSK